MHHKKIFESLSCEVSEEFMTSIWLQCLYIKFNKRYLSPKQFWNANPPMRLPWCLFHTLGSHIIAVQLHLVNYKHGYWETKEAPSWKTTISVTHGDNTLVTHISAPSAQESMHHWAPCFSDPLLELVTMHMQNGFRVNCHVIRSCHVAFLLAKEPTIRQYFNSNFNLVFRPSRVDLSLQSGLLGMKNLCRLTGSIERIHNISLGL